MPTVEYRSRFAKGRLRRIFNDYNNSFKKWLLLTVTKSQRLVRKYRIYDHHTLQHNAEFRFPNDEPRKAYNDIELKHLHFYDVIEIDSINEKSIKKFKVLAGESKRRGFQDNSDPVGIYRSFKNAMDYISLGGLVTVPYRGKKRRSNDYLQFVSVSFIKTMESYVVIRVDVTSSELFLSKFKEIISAEVNSQGIIHYRSYWQILTRKRFIDHQSMGTSSLSRGLDDLFYDMQHQVFQNILQYINGNFSRSRHLQKIPSMYYFEVKDLEGFHKDKKLQILFPRTFDSPFLSANGKTEVYLTELDKQNKNNLRIVRETPIDETTKEEKKSKQDIDLHFLLQSFAFPCAFRAKLNLQIDELNRLKRDIYDFTEYISNKRSLYVFSFFKISSMYIRLKIRLIKFVTSMKRFETEFRPADMTHYVDEEHLAAFTATKPRKERENLLALYMSTFNYLTRKYDSSIKGIQEVFKSVEELNAFRTNLVLQVFSVVIAILALFFAFDKVKQLFG